MFGKRFWWRELPAFVIGTGMMALAVNMVYSPMGMVPGGFSGLAILLSHMLYEYGRNSDGCLEHKSVVKCSGFCMGNF